jgi:hypothetical protein
MVFRVGQKQESHYTLKSPQIVAVQAFEDLKLPNPSEIKSA